jgi:hypothetical protein
MRSPSHSTRIAAAGLPVLLDEPPIATDLRARVASERAIAARLGADFFFDIAVPGG